MSLRLAAINIDNLMIRSDFSGVRYPGDPIDRWTLHHDRGPQKQWLCQLDHLWLSSALADGEVPGTGQPHRTAFPSGQAVERYPRNGWDGPKASDHRPIVMTMDF